MHTSPTDTPVAGPAALLDQDITCPLCEYNLRALTEPRCPECGFRFEWEDLLDPARQTHPYLFEHHPKRNIWSFFKTLRGAQFPRRFWTTLHPAQQSRPRRLLLYLLLVTLPVLFMIAALVGNETRSIAARLSANRAWITATLQTPRGKDYYKAELRIFPTTQAYIDAYFPQLPTTRLVRMALRDVGGLFPICTFAALWAPLTFLSLLIFQISMQRARIRSAHVLRCVIYSFDVILPWALLSAAAIALEPFLLPPPPWGRSTQLEPWINLGWFLFVAVASYRLVCAYDRYLRFHRPFATVAAAQVIVVLLALNLYVGIRLL